VDDADNWRWAGRPLRNLTDKEIERAMEDRREAVASASTEMARQFCQIALDRLIAEHEGRLARREWQS
jgi:hypothetical protein